MPATASCSWGLFRWLQGMSLITRSFIYTVLKKHQTNVLGLSKGQRLGNTQCMPSAMMLSSRLFLEDITCLHWVPLSYSFEHRFWQDTENWDNKGTQRACPPTNTYPATPSRYLHATWPPSLQATSFQVQPSSAPPFSSRLSNKDRLQPCFLSLEV